ncbi:exonuclease domain-containing protein [Actinopolyspora halophila]|uniref:exonuclease domain-containing protein n=1 Tax=Actinopolyspora halophila TaxID=1850 RepID=UPI0003605E6D|nr:exonuclease domain-containing protein [Actinopolyspora halophila]
MTDQLSGYAVVDTETTGVSAGYGHRIVEIAVVHVDTAGVVTDEWTTLLSPNRDLGPQAIHGIHASEVRHAPSFEHAAGELIDRLRDRVLVAHNWAFDAMHLRTEFDRCGIDTPFHDKAGLCTMRAAGQALPSAHRSLIDCCAAAGLPDRRWHTAHDDARAAADLLAYLLREHPATVQVTDQHLDAAQWPWPATSQQPFIPVHRPPIGYVHPHFLARLVERMPRDEEPDADSYFAMLDDALLDRQISATEADGLLELAHELGLHKTEVLALHHSYLRELVRTAWFDGVVTPAERTDIDTVATLLGLNQETVERVLAEEQDTGKQGGGMSTMSVTAGGLKLRPGDKVVLTGEMHQPRAQIQEQVKAAGLRVTSAVSKKTRLVAAADPDSLSGKAKDARKYGVPVVSEDAFTHALNAIER